MRAFGIELSANIRSMHGNRRELTTEERASIVPARMAGVTRKALADNFNCSPLTITRTCNHFKLYGTVESLPRSSRPLKLRHPDLDQTELPHGRDREAHFCQAALQV